MTFKLSIQGIACREKIITGRFLFWLLAVVYGASAQAQSYPYIVDFETANTSPPSKS
jgi:hypothetical protein